jgi:hypothetical protein
LRQQQQRLLLLRHASKCPQPEGQCRATPYCADMKRVGRYVGRWVDAMAWRQHHSHLLCRFCSLFCLSRIVFVVAAVGPHRQMQEPTLPSSTLRLVTICSLPLPPVQRREVCSVRSCP